MNTNYLELLEHSYEVEKSLGGCRVGASPAVGHNK
jgi:hypothetical protein